jgi:hypothetical protein
LSLDIALLSGANGPRPVVDFTMSNITPTYAGRSEVEPTVREAMKASMSVRQ